LKTIGLHLIGTSCSWI